jgi:hypothetical protein
MDYPRLVTLSEATMLIKEHGIGTAVHWQVILANPAERVKPPKVERKERSTWTMSRHNVSWSSWQTSRSNTVPVSLF